jgi:betaine-aldehyde dehydrogenase
MKIEYKGSHHINGAYVEDTNGKPIDLIYPATGAVVGRLHEATLALIEQALASAKAAQADWARTRPVERGRILRRAEQLLRARRDEIARIETIDTGRCLSETLYDADGVADALEFYGGVIQGYNGESIQLGEASAIPAASPWAFAWASARGITRLRMPDGNLPRHWLPAMR